MRSRERLEIKSCKGGGGYCCRRKAERRGAEAEGGRVQRGSELAYSTVVVNERRLTTEGYYVIMHVIMHVIMLMLRVSTISETSTLRYPCPQKHRL